MDESTMFYKSLKWLNIKSHCTQCKHINKCITYWYLSFYQNGGYEFTCRQHFLWILKSFMSRTKKLHCVVSIIFSHPHPKTLVLSKLDITIFTDWKTHSRQPRQFSFPRLLTEILRIALRLSPEVHTTNSTNHSLIE